MLEVGDWVIAIGCVSDRRGESEQAALVTRIISRTEIDVNVFVPADVFTVIVEQGLRHESVQPEGKRFRLKTNSSL